MEIGFDGGTEPVVYVISAEEFREWQLTRERLRDAENEAREWNRRYVGLAKGIRAALREAERDFCE